MASPPGRSRQVSISDALWEIYNTMADESGGDPDILINQAMFEMAVRLGYIAPKPSNLAPPLDDAKLPGLSSRPTRAPAGQKFTAGRTMESVSRKTSPPPAKRPPRPAPRPSKDEKGLHIVNEDGDKEKIDKDIFIIGRSSKCDLVINSVKVSREHAIITRERGDFFIEDLGSANGTWYKGERIEKMKIRDSDEIFICDEKFRFVLR